MNLNKKLAFVSLLLWFPVSAVYAQRTTRFTEPQFPLKKAQQFMDMQHYEQAYVLLNNYLTHFRQKPEHIQESDLQQATYAKNLCALKIGKPLAKEHFVGFVKETPFRQLQQIGNFELGKYYFEHNQFEAAIASYELVSIGILTNQELTERNFQLGYSYLVTGKLDKVEPYFQSAKSIPGAYFTPGNYYHGLLSYYKKDYPAAIASFNAVKEDPRYKKIIPFYLTEIDYVTGKKEKALSDALQYLKSADKLYYNNELNQMVAQIYCEQGEYSKAEFYYKTFVGQSKSVREEDYFKLGYCQYVQSKIDDAIPNFEKSVGDADELIAVYSAYLLAKCYLIKGEKMKAYDILSKNKSAVTSSRSELIEFTLATLSYDLNDNSAFAKLNGFITSHPNSELIEEANRLIVYQHIKNEAYKEAIDVLKGMKKMNYDMQKVYQKVSYARGVELFRNAETENAIASFMDVKKFPADKTLASLADFWLAELNYQSEKYEEAFTNQDLFLNLADTTSLPAYTKKIHLSKAYTYLRTQDTISAVQEYLMATGDTTIAELFTRMDSIKPIYTPEKASRVTFDSVVLIYNMPEEKIDFIYKPIPLKPLALNTNTKREDRSNFAKLAVGNLSSIDMEAGYLFDPFHSPLYVNVQHSSSTGTISHQNVNQTHVGMYTDIEVKGHTIEGAFEVDRNKQSYYGYDHTMYNYEGSDLTQIYQNIGLSATFTPMTANDHEIDYKADFYMGLYTAKSGAAEFTVKTDLQASKQLKNDLLAKSDIVLDLNVYGKSGVRTQNNSILFWRPSLTKQLGDIKIKAGLYPAIGKKFYLLPDVSVQYPVIKEMLNVELGVQSSIRLNTYKQLTELNPFLFDRYPVKQSRNTDFFASLTGNITANFCYALRSGVAVYNNLPLFINDTFYDAKQFDIIYETQATAFMLDASAKYMLSANLQFGAGMRLRPIVDLTTNKQAWHFIPSTINAYANVKPINKLSLQAELFLMAGARVPVSGNSGYKTLASGLDLNFSGRYSIYKRWNATLDVNNIFGSNYQRWNGYPMYGINAMAGVMYSFGRLVGK